MRLATPAGSPGPLREALSSPLCKRPSRRSPFSLSHTGLIYNGDVDDTSYHWQPSHTVPGFLRHPSLPFGPYSVHSLVAVPTVTTNGLGSGDGFTLLFSSTASYLFIPHSFSSLPAKDPSPTTHPKTKLPSCKVPLTKPAHPRNQFAMCV